MINCSLQNLSTCNQNLRSSSKMFDTYILRTFAGIHGLDDHGECLGLVLVERRIEI